MLSSNRRMRRRAWLRLRLMAWLPPALPNAHATSDGHCDACARSSKSSSSLLPRSLPVALACAWARSTSSVVVIPWIFLHHSSLLRRASGLRPVVASASSCATRLCRERIMLPSPLISHPRAPRHAALDRGSHVFVPRLGAGNLSSSRQMPPCFPLRRLL